MGLGEGGLYKDLWVEEENTGDQKKLLILRPERAFEPWGKLVQVGRFPKEARVGSLT